MNIINNTISFTPSNEQLASIANDYPELNQKIKTSVVEALEKNAVRYIQSRLQNKANTAYEALYQDVQKKFFISDNSYYSNRSAFSTTIEEKFKAQVEEALNVAVQEEFNTYINSAEFKRTLKNKVQEKIVHSAIRLLDAQILEETQKLIA